jgi:hypothetical protein
LRQEGCSRVVSAVEHEQEGGSAAAKVENAGLLAVAKGVQAFCHAGGSIAPALITHDRASTDGEADGGETLDEPVEGLEVLLGGGWGREGKEGGGGGWRRCGGGGSLLLLRGQEASGAAQRRLEPARSIAASCCSSSSSSISSIQRPSRHPAPQRLQSPCPRVDKRRSASKTQRHRKVRAGERDDVGVRLGHVRDELSGAVGLGEVLQEHGADDVREVCQSWGCCLGGEGVFWLGEEEEEVRGGGVGGGRVVVVVACSVAPWCCWGLGGACAPTIHAHKW